MQTCVRKLSDVRTTKNLWYQVHGWLQKKPAVLSSRMIYVSHCDVQFADITAVAHPLGTCSLTEGVWYTTFLRNVGFQTAKQTTCQSHHSTSVGSYYACALNTYQVYLFHLQRLCETGSWCTFNEIFPHLLMMMKGVKYFLANYRTPLIETNTDTMRVWIVAYWPKPIRSSLHDGLKQKASSHLMHFVGPFYCQLQKIQQYANVRRTFYMILKNLSLVNIFS